mmetsp:Transcript_7578/g.17195  ORF Transcript_7578/g.17195 Transcript_7578/m.17195 type:complete len:178 (+) Transcript_7578:228-761(+)
MFSRFVQSSSLLRQATANNSISSSNATSFIRSTSSTRRALSVNSTTPKSSSPLLAGDAGKKATHLHHRMTTFLAFATPLYLFTPSSYTDGMLDKSFGVLVATAISAHSWIGLNYVATDYVPKISKALIGPARVFNLVLGVVTFVGLSKIALNDEGGVKGTVAGLWRPVVAVEGEKKE